MIKLRNWLVALAVLSGCFSACGDDANDGAVVPEVLGGEPSVVNNGPSASGNAAAEPGGAGEAGTENAGAAENAAGGVAGTTG